MPRIEVLRIGHRPVRDKRASTHVGLVSRAFGADGIYFSGKGVKKVKESLEKVREEWGGSFFIEEVDSWKKILNEWKDSEGQIIHLTMYGSNLNNKISDVKGEDTLIVVGAEKVPWEVYEKADYNIAVGNQPHSEIAALSVFLDRFLSGEELEKEFPGAERKVKPCEEGKKVLDLSDED